MTASQPNSIKSSGLTSISICFLIGRFIGENIRLSDRIMNYTNTEKIPGLLLFVDFKKALDSTD